MESKKFSKNQPVKQSVSVNPVIKAKTRPKVAVERIKKTDKGLVISFTKTR